MELAKLFRISADFILKLERTRGVDLSKLTEREVRMIYDSVDHFRQTKGKSQILKYFPRHGTKGPNFSNCPVRLNPAYTQKGTSALKLASPFAVCSNLPAAANGS